jgi:hypothetical protein
MLPLLNPRPRVTLVPIFDGHQCVIVDDFMLEPEELVGYAANNHAHFQDVPGNYYPGPELPISGTFAARVHDSFLQHARTPLKARRILDVKSRLSLVTRRAEDLLPGQRLPHRDFSGLPAGVGVGAMVLYLFRDERFGGTSFFKPKVPEHEIRALENDLRRRERAASASTWTASGTNSPAIRRKSTRRPALIMRSCTPAPAPCTRPSRNSSAFPRMPGTTRKSSPTSCPCRCSRSAAPNRSAPTRRS